VTRNYDDDDDNNNNIIIIIINGPSPEPPSIGATAEQGSKCNKRIRWRREGMKEVAWCFLCVKDRTSTENYKASYELWRKRNRNLRTNTDAR
jgi:hypothetical protein